MCFIETECWLLNNRYLVENSNMVDCLAVSMSILKMYYLLLKNNIFAQRPLCLTFITY